ncbi:MAG: preprotein translocase subunit SecG [Phycisphaerales bacterium]
MSAAVAIFLFACVVMMLTVLIQRPQGGGLSGRVRVGRRRAGQTAFGTKTGDALTIATIVMFVVFLGLAVGLNYATRPENIATGQPVAQSADNGQGDGTTDAEGHEYRRSAHGPAGRDARRPRAPAGDDKRRVARDRRPHRRRPRGRSSRPAPVIRCRHRRHDHARRGHGRVIHSPVRRDRPAARLGAAA